MCLSQEWILMEISKVQVRGQQQDRGSWGHWWDLCRTLGETLGIRSSRVQEAKTGKLRKEEQPCLETELLLMIASEMPKPAHEAGGHTWGGGAPPEGCDSEMEAFVIPVSPEALLVPQPTWGLFPPLGSPSLCFCSWAAWRFGTQSLLTLALALASLPVLKWGAPLQDGAYTRLRAGTPCWSPVCRGLA